MEVEAEIAKYWCLNREVKMCPKRDKGRFLERDGDEVDELLDAGGCV